MEYKPYLLNYLWQERLKLMLVLLYVLRNDYKPTILIIFAQGLNYVNLVFFNTGLGTDDVFASRFRTSGNLISCPTLGFFLPNEKFFSR